MSYTYKKLILSTWKLLQPVNEIQLGGELPDPKILSKTKNLGLINQALAQFFPTEVYFYPGDTSDEDDELDTNKVIKNDDDSDDDFSYRIS